MLMSVSIHQSTQSRVLLINVFNHFSESSDRARLAFGGFSCDGVILWAGGRNGFVALYRRLIQSLVNRASVLFITRANLRERTTSTIVSLSRRSLTETAISGPTFPRSSSIQATLNLAPITAVELSTCDYRRLHENRSAGIRDETFRWAPSRVSS